MIIRTAVWCLGFWCVSAVVYAGERGVFFKQNMARWLDGPASDGKFCDITFTGGFRISGCKENDRYDLEAMGRSIAQKIEHEYIQVPGYVEFLPSDERIESRDRTVAGRKPNFGLYAGYGGENFLYFTSWYQGTLLGTKKRLKKNIRFSLKYFPTEVAMTLVREEIWHRRFRDSTQFGFFAKPFPDIKLMRRSVDIGLSAAYDLDDRTVVFVRVRILP